jgi:hypothetical protein
MSKRGRRAILRVCCAHGVSGDQALACSPLRISTDFKSELPEGVLTPFLGPHSLYIPCDEFFARCSMKRLVREGVWIGVPLETGGFTPVLVARVSKQPGVLLGYCFPIQGDLRQLDGELKTLSPKDAVVIARFGELGVIEGRWPVLAEASGWVRECWPTPFFSRREEFTGRMWLIEYDDVDPSEEKANRPASLNDPAVPRDGLYGALAFEKLLTKLVGN